MSPPRQIRAVVLAIAATLAIAAGCGARDEGHQASEATGPVDEQERIERLRALPYAGGSARRSGEGRGVIRARPGAMAPGLTLYTIQPLNRAELIDAEGRVVRRWEEPTSLVWERSLLMPGGDLLAIGVEDRRPAGMPGLVLLDDARYLVRLSPGDEAVWRRQVTVHHDVLPVGDGELVALTFERRRSPRHHPTADVRDDRLTWLRAADGAPLRSRSLLDAIDASPDVFPLQLGAVSSTAGEPWLDLLHSNAVQRIPAGHDASRHPAYTPGAWLVTFRHQDRVAVFDPDVERVLWAWGRGELGGPHDAQLLDDGRLLIFDNGLGRNASRVIELDPATETIVWSYEGNPPESFYTASKGSAQRLPNGNTLIAESDRGRIVEVDAGGDIVWEFLCPYDTDDGQRAAVVRARRIAP